MNDYKKISDRSFNELVDSLYTDDFRKSNCKEITFQVPEIV